MQESAFSLQEYSFPLKQQATPTNKKHNELLQDGIFIKRSKKDSDKSLKVLRELDQKARHSAPDMEKDFEVLKKRKNTETIDNGSAMYSSIKQLVNAKRIQTAGGMNNSELLPKIDQSKGALERTYQVDKPPIKGQMKKVSDYVEKYTRFGYNPVTSTPHAGPHEGFKNVSILLHKLEISTDLSVQDAPVYYSKNSTPQMTKGLAISQSVGQFNSACSSPVILNSEKISRHYNISESSKQIPPVPKPNLGPILTPIAKKNGKLIEDISGNKIAISTKHAADSKLFRGGSLKEFKFQKMPQYIPPSHNNLLAKRATHLQSLDKIIKNCKNAEPDHCAYNMNIENYERKKEDLVKKKEDLVKKKDDHGKLKGEDEEGSDVELDSSLLQSFT